MRQEDERVLVLLAAMYLISKYSWQVAPALQRGGASAYDWLHNDEGHKRDLPGKQLTRQALLAIATRAGFPDPKLAAAVALAESGGVTNAVLRNDREYSVGLWQINTRRHAYSPEEMSDPDKNAAAAFAISARGTNWNPWSAYKSGRYRQFQTGVLA